jgi:hypothetical protein
LSEYKTSTAAAAARHNVTQRRIQLLIKQGRIPGAEMIGGIWLLPADFTILPPPKRNRTLQKILID